MDLVGQALSTRVCTACWALEGCKGAQAKVDGQTEQDRENRPPLPSSSWVFLVKLSFFSPSLSYPPSFQDSHSLSLSLLSIRTTLSCLSVSLESTVDLDLSLEEPPVFFT